MPGVKGKSGGHNRKTNAEKISIGARKDRINFNAPAAISGEIVEHGELTEKGREIRDKYLPMLINNRTLSVTDSIIFFMFCDTAAQYYEVRKERIEKGRYVDIYDKEGNSKKAEAPWTKLEKELIALTKNLATSLGLTPLDRDKIIRLADNKPLNKWSEYK